MGDPDARPDTPPPAPGPWWGEVTRYQWMVLAIASAGWIFDIFEGQLFGSMMNEALPELLRGSGLEGSKELVVNLALGGFLLGGALGGIGFGIMADRWGRRRTMALTILLYSIFTGLTALVENWWQLIGLRFLVGLGVGGEWAVAAALVAETFPPRARPAASGIFHASSVLGTYLAVVAGLAFGTAALWRGGFLLGILPALLILWVRVSMRDPESWQAARAEATKDSSRKLGRFRDLFTDGTLRRSTLLATALAAIGLATFWGAHFRGKDVLRAARNQVQRTERAFPALAASTVGLSGSPLPLAPLVTASALRPRAVEALVDAGALKRSEMLGMFLVTTGGGLGLLSFAPISQRVGRRPAFVFFHLGGFVLTAVVWLVAGSIAALLIVLPIFGFFTLGMHAGYAVYFPELYPTRLRGTGAGFCFNMARVVVGPVLIVFAWLQGSPLHLGLSGAMFVLGGLFLLGALLMIWCPETRGRPLPE